MTTGSVIFFLPLVDFAFRSYFLSSLVSPPLLSAFSEQWSSHCPININAMHFARTVWSNSLRFTLCLSFCLRTAVFWVFSWRLNIMHSFIQSQFGGLLHSYWHDDQHLLTIFLHMIVLHKKEENRARFEHMKVCRFLEQALK